MIVIDCGCARYSDEHYSIERLIEMYHPTLLYGFDPAWPQEQPTVWTTGSLLTAGGTGLCTVAVHRVAAWTYGGEVRFMLDGMNGQVGTNDNWSLVECFDLAKFIETLGSDQVILKLDVEMAEYPLLEHLIQTKMDERLSLALVEWHDLPDGSHDFRRRKIERSIACPLETWDW